jgi:hypothetical protein
MGLEFKKKIEPYKILTNFYAVKKFGAPNHWIPFTFYLLYNFLKFCAKIHIFVDIFVLYLNYV